MNEELQARLLKFLDDYEIAKAKGITLESLHVATRNLADALSAHISSREDLAKDILDLTIRVNSLENSATLPGQ